MNRKTTVSLVIGIVLSLPALYLAFRNVPINALVSYMGQIDYLWMIPAVVVVLFGFVARAIRWQIILSASHRLGFWSAYHPMMIGFAVNCILPGRIGEIARPIILQRKERVPFTTGLATVAAERLFDIVMLVAFFALVLSLVDIDPNIQYTFGGYVLNRETLIAIGSGMVKLCIVLIAGVVLVSLTRTRRLIVGIIQAVPRWFSFAGERWTTALDRWLAKPMVRIVENVAAGFQTVKRPMDILICLALSVIVWGSAAVAYYLVAMGSPGIDLSLGELAASMVIVSFFIALPSVPGFWGIWEAGGVFALSLFAIPAKEAAGFTLVNHAVQMFPIIFAGLASALITGVSIRQVAASAGSKPLAPPVARPTSDGYNSD